MQAAESSRCASAMTELEQKYRGATGRIGVQRNSRTREDTGEERKRGFKAKNVFPRTKTENFSAAGVVATVAEKASNK